MTDTNDDDKRRKLAERIAALRNMTVENGCTEEEALSAASKAAELMDLYDMSLSEMEMRRSRFTRSERPASDDVGQRLWRVASAVSSLTGTRSWSSGSPPRERIHFFGRDSDVEVAGYVFEIAERAIRTAVAAYDKQLAFYRPERRRPKRIAFIDGMVVSLARRIEEISWARRRQASDGTGLVPTKHGLVDAEMERQGIKIVYGGGERVRRYDKAFDLGKSEAEKVRLDAGLGTSAGVSGNIGHDR
jgi:Protein of unknown function (DUF2786).